MKDNQKDENSFFVSRRGKQVGVHQVDLTGINIESNESDNGVEQIKTAKKTQKTKEIAPKKSTKRTGWTKKKMVVATVILALLLVPIIFAEFVVAQYSGGLVGAKRDFTSLVKTTVLPMQKKTAISADQLRTVGVKLNDIASRMCRGGLFDNAAGLYPRAKTALDTCHTEQSKYAALVTSIYALESDARYLEKVDAVMKPAATPITDEYAVLDAQQATWLQAVEDLKKLNPSDRMRTAHGDLLKNAGEVATSWSKLNIANTAHNAAGFEAAEAALVTHYEAVRSTSEAFSTVLVTSQAKVTADYSVLK